jgi:hypothetical protein
MKGHKKEKKNEIKEEDMIEKRDGGKEGREEERMKDRRDGRKVTLTLIA